MFKKKYMWILFLILAIGCISSVSANDLNQTDEIAIVDGDDEISIDNNEEIIVNDGEDLLASEDEDEPMIWSVVNISHSGKYACDKVVKFTLTDLKGNPLPNEEIWIEFQEQVDSSDNQFFEVVKTDSNGVFTYKWDTSELPPGTYSIYSLPWSTGGNETKIVDVKIINKPIKFKATALTAVFKSNSKFKVRVLDADNKPLKKVKVRLEIYTGNKHVNKYITTDSKGYAYYKPGGGLDKGYHKVIVCPTSGYSAKKVYSKISIKAKRLDIDGLPTSFKDCTQLIIGVFEKSSEKPVNGIAVKIKIYTKSKYKTFTLKTGYVKHFKSNGLCLIETNKFSVGTHKVKVTFASKNYVGSASGNIKILKSTKNYSKFTYVISAGKGKFV